MAKSLNQTEKSNGFIVIVEDESESLKAMKLALGKKGYHVEAFTNADEGIRFISGAPQEIDLVITDLRMPGTDGLTVLKETKKANAEISVILVTAYASVDSAVQAMKLGADDYLTKPIDLYEFRARVSKLMTNSNLNREVEMLNQRLDKQFGFDNIIGRSQPMEALFDKIRVVAGTNANVLLLGESGTGKELIANALHQHSQKRGQRFLPINCAAIPSDILESELFGHERGSFTGAVTRKIGKFELAANGTLFLDEIGDMNLDLQAKLLRVLENRELTRVGGSEPIHIHSRFLFATNRNLQEEVREGRFREDLYYRMNVVTLNIPPLWQRRDDIPLLVHYFIGKFNQEHGKQVADIDPVAMKRLTAYPWPGNIRELRNVVEHLVIFNRDGVISEKDFPDYLGRKEDIPVAVTIPVGMTMGQLEQEAIRQMLAHCGGNKTRAAELLDISLRTLQRKVKEMEGGDGDSDDES